MAENPFAGQDVTVSDNYRTHFETYVQRREGKGARPEHQPFDRNVDFWFAAICVAVRNGIKPSPPTGKTYKAAEGVALGSPEWRPTALTLLAIAENGDASIVDRPGEMMRIANAYAHVGFPELLEILESRGGDTALDHLSEAIEAMLTK
ncbi:hypothetical protein SAMN03159463_02341 [Mesorhizobium sp. NFR06]|uniref:hypothetical protein n=1 Tax=Mesorhizobium sp. NFR06 TaxID=1566290 RepID=UPI0008F06FB8|nr:hypothetical protein [Mesorhizobium sp. NFR06]SFO57983.1 hypothetical protein SAMN03159463_02341 [Mesorhizobium sp. NFR06]